MGCLGSKDRLTKEDMEFLKSHTRYDEATIKEWYKGFKKLLNIREALPHLTICAQELSTVEDSRGKNKTRIMKDHQ
uniref:Uncharacterized protein n=1 Tax=Lutzomyia longipalpis TaxID=7200 RepID=A0A1B0CDL3_LUTLO